MCYSYKLQLYRISIKFNSVIVTATGKWNNLQMNHTIYIGHICCIHIHVSFLSYDKGLLSSSLSSSSSTTISSSSLTSSSSLSSLSYCTNHGRYLVRFWRYFVGNCYFGKFSLKFSDFFSRSNTIFAISQELLVRSMWNEKEVHRFVTGYNISLRPLTSLMTLTLDVSRSNFEIAVSEELLVWLMWNEKETHWYDTARTVWLCPLTTPISLSLEFQGQSLK